jgi:hypothetical protein
MSALKAAGLPTYAAVAQWPRSAWMARSCAAMPSIASSQPTRSHRPGSTRFIG